MRFVRFPALLSLSIALAACASGPDNTSGQLASAPASNCSIEVPTGSSLPHKTCRAAMTDAERDQAQRDLINHGQPSRN